MLEAVRRRTAFGALGWAREGSVSDDDVVDCELLTLQVTRFRSGGPVSNEHTVGDFGDANPRNAPIADHELAPCSITPAENLSDTRDHDLRPAADHERGTGEIASWLSDARKAEVLWV